MVLDVTAVADMGKMSIIVDPTGATLGLWQSHAALSRNFSTGPDARR